MAFIPDSPKSRFTPDVTPEIVPSRLKAPAYGGKEGIKRLIFGGPTGYFSASGSEDVLPAIGQTVGSVYGGYGGSVAGATTGQAMSQGVKAIRGTRDSAPRKLFGVGPQAHGIVNDLAGEAAGTATMEGVFRVGGKIAKPIANRLMIAAIKPSKEAIKRIPNFGNEAAEQGFFGSLNNMKNKAVKYLDDIEPKLQDILSKSSKTIKTDDVIKEFSELERRALNINDKAALEAIQNVKDAILKKGKEIPVAEANQLKRDFYSALKDSQWGKGVGEVPQIATARKSGAYGLKEGINKAEPSVIPLNKKTGMAAEVLEGVGKQQEKTWYKPLIPFVEAMGGLGGLATGNPWLTTAIIGRRLASSPTALSTTAKLLTELAKPAVGKPVSIATRELTRRFGSNN